ncbi:MAG: Metallophos protein [Bacteroidota bacterium]|nr:Metallophos protein [Bacteroidota bacterium]
MKLLISSIFAMIFFTMPEFDRNAGSQAQKPLFSFGVIADVQYCDCEPKGSRYFRMSPLKLREAVNSLKVDSVAFLINLGDLIDRDYSSFKPVLDILDSSEIKTWHLTGNHDYSVDSQLKKRLPVPMPSKEGFYSFNHKNFRFIALNGNELSTYGAGGRSQKKAAQKYLSSLRDSGSVNAMDWNGGMSRKQLGWLNDQLEEAAAKGEKVFILCHFPVYPENVHNLLNSNEVLEILSKYDNIIAWIAGHNHSGNYGNFNQIHFITMRGMVETEASGSFAIIEVYRNKIWIKGSGGEKSQILAY